VIGQPAPSLEALGLGDMWQVHAVLSDPENDAALAAASIASPSYYVLRPDGHVGLSGTVFHESDLKRWIAQRHLRLAGRSAPRAVMVS
jgi:hypothetical protein